MSRSTSRLVVSAASPNRLLNLPTELLTELFSWLPARDRRKLGQVNDRLKQIEKYAGYHRFTTIEVFANCDAVDIIATNEHSGKVTFNYETTINELARYFKNGKTDNLVIKARMNTESEHRLKVAFRSLKFNKLEAHFIGDYSGSIISELVRGHNFIDKVKIKWAYLNKASDNAKRVLLALPMMTDCVIKVKRREHNMRPLIDDAVLLHLVRNTTEICHLNCLATTVTGKGIEQAFEMVYNSEDERSVSCYVSPEVVTTEFFPNPHPRLSVDRERKQVEAFRAFAVLNCSKIFTYDREYEVVMCANLGDWPS